MANLLFDASASNSETSKGFGWWFSGDTFERNAYEERNPHSRSLSYRLNSHPGRLTIIYFVALMTISTSLLCLPIATQPGKKSTFSTAFFTAVSALSTCGISVVNTTDHWTIFGQVVLIFSVQMGGLGVMTFASLIALAVNHHLKAMQRLLAANELGTNKLSEIRGVLQVVLMTTLVIEVVTFFALFPGLLSVNKGNVGRTLWESLFFAVMSYNNAGFTPDGAGLYVNNWAVGLPKHWSLHTKITMIMTFAIVFMSLIWFLAVEWDNPVLFKDGDVDTRMRRAMVAAVMPRSSGFDLSWVPGVKECTKVFMSIVMFIGGGSTSTAGGIRVTTLAVILLVCKAAFTGHTDVNAFHKRIPQHVIMTAISITASCVALVFIASVALMLITDSSLSHAMFDTCSAFGLGGYTVGVAQENNPASLYVLAAAMVVGRLGPMTLAYAVSRPKELDVVRYPEGQIVVG